MYSAQSFIKYRVKFETEHEKNDLFKLREKTKIVFAIDTGIVMN